MFYVEVFVECEECGIKGRTKVPLEKLTDPRLRNELVFSCLTRGWVISPMEEIAVCPSCKLGPHKRESSVTEVPLVPCVHVPQCGDEHRVVVPVHKAGEKG